MRGIRGITGLLLPRAGWSSRCARSLCATYRAVGGSQTPVRPEPAKCHGAVSRVPSSSRRQEPLRRSGRCKCAKSNRVGLSVGALLNESFCREKLEQYASAWNLAMQATSLAQIRGDSRGPVLAFRTRVGAWSPCFRISRFACRTGEPRSDGLIDSGREAR